MGILRYFLAIIVVISHSPFINEIPKPLYANGGLAVAAFFVISGFYMSLIAEKYQLNKKSYSTLKNFYLSRFFRIYPIYLLCLLITLALYSFKLINLSHAPFESLKSFNNIFDKSLYVFSNLFILGQSFIRFFIFDAHTGNFIFHPTNNLNIPPQDLGSSYAVLGQAWSLSLEFTFYILVPFILLRSKKFLALLCAGSFLLRIMLMHIDSKSSFASDIFFPLTIGVFLLGSLSHQLIYKHIKDKATLYPTKITAIVLALSIILFSMYANLYHSADNYTALFYLMWWTFVLLIAISIPFIFLYSKNWKWDQAIGELSFPVYMSHLFCLEIITRLTTSVYTAYYAIALTTVISILMTYVIIKPLDIYRHSRFLKSAPPQLINSLKLPLTDQGVVSA